MEEPNFQKLHQQFRTKIDLGIALLEAELLKVRIFQQDGIYVLMEACSFLLRPWDRTVGKVFLDKRFPLGALFIAAIQPEVHGKTHRTTDIMTRDGIMSVVLCVFPWTSGCIAAMKSA